MIKSELENKIWYRAVKTIYILVYALVLIIILVWGYSFKPYQSVDQSSSTITCANGTKYNPQSSTLTFDDGTLDNISDLEVRKLCGDPADWAGREAAGNGAIPFTKNYSVQVAHKTSGSWSTPLQIWIIGFGIEFVLFEAIKRTFLYIAIGKKFL